MVSGKSGVPTSLSGSGAPCVRITALTALHGRALATMLREVGPIGGIEDKLIGAKRAGATLFIAPIDNCIDITRIPKGLQIVAVSTLGQAVTLLKKPAQDLAKLPALSGCFTA